MALSPLKFLGKLPFAAGLIFSTQMVLAGALTNVSVTPADPTAGATTTYTFTYTTETDLNADTALLYVTFPAGFSVGAGACDRIDSFTLNPDPGGAICRDSYGSGETVGFAVNTTIGGGVSVPGGTQVSVVVKAVTNPATPGDYVFDPTGGVFASSGIYTAEMSDPMFPFEIDVAPQQTVTIGGGGGGEDGVCGASNGGTFSTAPVASLCSAGSATAVTTNATTYTWDCNGTGGSVVVDSCSANKGYDLILSISPPSGGSVSCTSNPVIHAGNTTCTPTASPGYSFANWSGDCSGATCILNNVTSSLNPQANFTLNTYAITTAVNPAPAGTVSCTANPVDHGSDSSCTYTTNPGYTFANWSGDCTGATCDLVGVTGAKSVTANFTAPTFAITTAVNPSGAGTVSCTPNPVNGGSNATCTATAGTAYSFTGWSGDCTGASCELVAVSSLKSVTANFSLKSYSISGSALPAAGGVVSCGGSASHGSNSSCTATAATGYSFSSWSGCPSASGNTCNFTNVTADQSVTASFTLNTYTVTGAVSPAASGLVSCTNPVNHGTSTNCTATAATGFSLTGWTGCTSSSGTTCTLSNVTADSGVTANFAVSTYTLAGTANPTAGGGISCTSQVNHGATGTCTATAAAGYTLGSWSGCSTIDGVSCTVTNMTANKTVSATFVINSYTVTAVASPIDAGSATCTSPVVHGSSASCTANAAAGYRLKDWSGACTGSSCAIASVTANSAVTANFELLPIYNISTSVSPADSGTITCTKDIMEGGTGTCTAKAKAGYRFSSWGGDCSGTATNCTLTNVTSGKSVSATFEQPTSFNITASLQPILGSASNLPMTSSDSNHVLCSKNPVALGETVSCRFVQGRDVGYGVEIGATQVSVLKGWGGECTRVEGDNCIIENISTDKQITVYSGLPYTNKMQIIPAGAGSVWCNVLVDLPPPPVQFVQDNCKAEPNSGYEFESFSAPPFCAGALCPRATATFKQKSNTPVVNCDACNSSTTETDTSTTKTSSQTSTPDNQGNSTQSTVSTSTNTQTGDTSTKVMVNQIDANGQTKLGGLLTLDGKKTVIDVGSDGTNKVTIDGGALVVNASSQGLSGEFGGGSGLGGKTTFSAITDKPIISDYYNFEFTSNGDEITEFKKPVELKLPVSDTSDYDTDLLTLAKIINGKLEYYGGKYNSDANNFEAKRNSFKPRAKLASDDYAFIGTEWSEGVNSNLEMLGTEQTTLIKNTVTLDENAPVSIQTQLTLASGKVETTLTVASAQNSVMGNIMAGSASIKVGGVLGNFTVIDKQSPENDSRAVSVVLVNGQLDSVDVSNAQGAQILYTAMADANAPKAIGFESSADSFSVTLSYPAAQ